MRHRHAALLAVAAVGAYGLRAVTTSSAGVRLGAATANAVMFPTGFGSDIYVGSKRVYTGSAPSTTSSSSVPASSTSSAPPATSTTLPATSTSAPTTTSPSTGGAAFVESFADPTAFASRFDHGWSGELHAGALFGGDRDGWMGDHDGMCGDPNNTKRMVHLGPGHMGEDSPTSYSDPAFYSCLPGGDPAKGHVMTSANTEGYIIAWFSPKPVFTNVSKVCASVDFTYVGNGMWWQMVFETPGEYQHKPSVDGTQYGVLDLGYTSPDFPNNGGPSTPQGTAQAGVKFLVAGDDAASAELVIRPWSAGQFTGMATGGPGTTNHAPRYPVCVTDNGNGTLTIVNGSPDGTTHTNTVPGAIPDGPVRVVFEHDEYNPDKHHRTADPQDIPANTGEGYTIHWDDIQVS